MKIILRVAGVILVLLAIVGTITGGWTANQPDPTPEKFIQLGGKRLVIPPDTPRNVFAVTEAAMQQIGMEPWYRACVIRQAERLLSPAEAKRLARSPQVSQANLEVMLKAQPHCDDSRRNILDPQASPSQLSFVRAQTAESFRALFAEEGAGDRLQDCVATQIQRATDKQILALANAPEAIQESIVLTLLNPCE